MTSRAEDRTWIDEVADRFERACRAGQQPRIDDYLTGAEGPRRSKLLEEVLRIDREIRESARTPPDPEDYARRFPGHASGALPPERGEGDLFEQDFFVVGLGLKWIEKSVGMRPDLVGVFAGEGKGFGSEAVAEGTFS